MEEIAIKNGTIFTPFRAIKRGVIVINNGKIVAIGRKEDVRIPTNAIEIDASGKIVAPGFIDLHTNGARGYNVIDGSYEAIKAMAKFAIEHGTTAFIPTTVTAPQKIIVAAASSVKEATIKGTGGAQVLGVHLEGPYINFEMRGAQNPDYIRKPSMRELEQVLNASGNNVKIVTIAPEIDGGLEFIKELKKRNIVVSVGHSNATYDEIVSAIRAGLSYASHTFNGMERLHHREPGVIGAVLTRDEITAEVIADGIHVHPAAIKILVRAKGRDKVVLVTDNIGAAGMPDGVYTLSGLEVIVKNGICRLRDGTLAGSTLTMDVAVKNMVELVELPLKDALIMATANPARVIGIDNKGCLETDKDADIVILNKHLGIYMTIVQGNIVYRASEVATN
jgi:N-acetylglucosamine-6-phosphate deacetylase